MRILHFKVTIKIDILSIFYYLRDDICDIYLSLLTQSIAAGQDVNTSVFLARVVKEELNIKVFLNRVTKE